jgi:hypothetical protein
MDMNKQHYLYWAAKTGFCNSKIKVTLKGQSHQIIDYILDSENLIQYFL